MLKKVIITILSLGVAAYLIVAITMFNRPKETQVCSEVVVSVEDSLQTGFLKNEDILKLLTKKKCNPKGRKFGDVDLKQIETVLKANPYVSDVLCYKTPGGKVCINVVQRYAIMHVMANNGEDYYLDRQGKPMPQSAYCADLPIATGYITKNFARQHLTILGRLLAADQFWNKQIQQIDVNADGTVSLVPRVGEHIILLGHSLNVKEKLDRMKKFYAEGLNRVGWNKYSTINLEYDNQIICKKK